MTETLGERRRRLLRDEIGRVAIGLFAERGFDAVTVDDIAAEAGTSQRTFFRYFATKDEVVLDYERRLVARLVAALAARPPDEGGVTALREAFCETSHVEPIDRPRVVQLGRILDATPALLGRAQGVRVADNDLLVAQVAGRMGANPSDFRPRAVVAAMSAVAATEFRAWATGGGEDDPAARIRAALGLVEAGLASHDVPARAGRRADGRH